MKVKISKKGLAQSLTVAFISIIFGIGFFFVLPNFTSADLGKIADVSKVYNNLTQTAIITNKTTLETLVTIQLINVTNNASIDKAYYLLRINYPKDKTLSSTSPETDIEFVSDSLSEHSVGKGYKFEMLKTWTENVSVSEKGKCSYKSITDTVNGTISNVIDKCDPDTLKTSILTKSEYVPVNLKGLTFNVGDNWLRVYPIRSFVPSGKQNVIDSVPSFNGVNISEWVKINSSATNALDFNISSTVTRAETPFRVFVNFTQQDAGNEPTNCTTGVILYNYTTQASVEFDPDISLHVYSGGKCQASTYYFTQNTTANVNISMQLDWKLSSETAPVSTQQLYEKNDFTTLSDYWTRGWSFGPCYGASSPYPAGNDKIINNDWYMLIGGAIANCTKSPPMSSNYLRAEVVLDLDRNGGSVSWLGGPVAYNTTSNKYFQWGNWGSGCSDTANFCGNVNSGNPIKQNWTYVTNNTGFGVWYYNRTSGVQTNFQTSSYSSTLQGSDLLYVNSIGWGAHVSGGATGNQTVDYAKIEAWVPDTSIWITNLTGGSSPSNTSAILYANNISSPPFYDPVASTRFNITIQNSNGTVLLEINKTGTFLNYSMDNKTFSTYGYVDTFRDGAYSGRVITYSSIGQIANSTSYIYNFSISRSTSINITLGSSTYIVDQNSTTYYFNKSWTSLSLNPVLNTTANLYNTTINCQNYLIHSSGGAGFGMKIYGSNLSVVNCIFQNFGTSDYFFSGANNNTVLNNTAIGVSSYGFQFSGSDNNSIINNTIDTTSDGFYLHSGSDYNILEGNVANNLVGTGFRFAASTHNSTIRNNSASSNTVYGIFMNNGRSSKIIGNKLDGNQYGVYLENSADNNYFANNSVAYSTADGVHLDASLFNSFNNDSIFGSSSYDYSLTTTFNTNNFSGTNFTGSRSIKLGNQFRFNNQSNGDIWLVTGGGHLSSRVLGIWNNTHMLWNDTNITDGQIEDYNLTGLIVGEQYNIYNSSPEVQTNIYNLTAGSFGDLNFSITLAKNTQIKLLRTDTTNEAIIYSGNVSSPSQYDKDTLTKFNVTVENSNSTVTLEGNFTGSFKNYSMSTTQQSNFNLSLVSPAGTFSARTCSYSSLNGAGNCSGYIFNYSIAKGPPSLSVGFNQTSPKNYENITGVYGNASLKELQSSTISIFRNGTLDQTGVGNQSYGIVLGVGIWQFNVTSTATQNYSGSSLNGTNFVITQAPATLTFLVNGTTTFQNFSEVRTIANFTGTSDKSVSLALTSNMTNWTTQTSSSNRIDNITLMSYLPNNPYNITLSILPTQNYSAVNVTRQLIYDSSAPVLTLYTPNETSIDLELNHSVNFSVSVSDLTSLSNVIVELNTPSNRKTNYTATRSGILYTATAPIDYFTWSSVGNYTAKVYANDSLGHMNSSQSFVTINTGIVPMSTSTTVNATSQLIMTTSLLQRIDLWHNMTILFSPNISNTANITKSLNLTLPTNGTSNWSLLNETRQNLNFTVSDNGNQITIQFTTWNISYNSTQFQYNLMYKGNREISIMTVPVSASVRRLYWNTTNTSEAINNLFVNMSTPVEYSTSSYHFEIMFCSSGNYDGTCSVTLTNWGSSQSSSYFTSQDADSNNLKDSLSITGINIPSTTQEGFLIATLYAGAETSGTTGPPGGGGDTGPVVTQLPVIQGTNQTTTQACGNGVCEVGENFATCSADCVKPVLMDFQSGIAELAFIGASVGYKLYQDNQKKKKRKIVRRKTL